MDQFISVNQVGNGRRNNKKCSIDFIRTKNTITRSKSIDSRRLGNIRFNLAQNFVGDTI